MRIGTDRPGLAAAALGALLAWAPGAAKAQEAAHGAHATRAWRVGAQVVPLLTHASPAMQGDDRTEGYLTQPLLWGHAALWGGRAEVEGMLNGEGLTLRRGELNHGIWGEGYVDRRHPHTLLHAATLTLRAPLAGARGASLTVGKGFAPFGTDDPMSRPPIKFPANHHLAQILERGVAILALRAGAGTLEVGAFNGNEPESPEEVLDLRRFGDSWSTRLTLRPAPGVEVQGSHARVASPELPASSEVEHRKWSASARVERSASSGTGSYALLEWARTDEHASGGRFGSYTTLLGEGALRRRGVEVGARLERTERPEEERLLDPFRTPRPHSDLHRLGVTRWSIVTAHLAAGSIARGVVRGRPFLEVSHARVSAVGRSPAFDPERFYGSRSIRSLSAGIRLTAGPGHGRMGRYGAASDARHGAHDAGS